MTVPANKLFALLSFSVLLLVIASRLLPFDYLPLSLSLAFVILLLLGGLIVSYEAAGWLEMAWHLYKWGDSVEVIAPDQLRRMVEGHRRDDFPSLP